MNTIGANPVTGRDLADFAATTASPPAARSVAALADPVLSLKRKEKSSMSFQEPDDVYSSATDEESARRWAAVQGALGVLPLAGRRSCVAERDRLREAGERAIRLYPGPVGELVCREIFAFLEFGYQFAQGALIDRLVEEVLSKTLDPLDGQARPTLVAASPPR